MAETSAQEKYQKERAELMALEEATKNHTECQHAYLNAIEVQKESPEDKEAIEDLQTSRNELTEASNSLLKLTTEKE